jgi:hypothetical protein
MSPPRRGKIRGAETSLVRYPFDSAKETGHKGHAFVST